MTTANLYNQLMLQGTLLIALIVLSCSPKASSIKPIPQHNTEEETKATTQKDSSVFVPEEIYTTQVYNYDSATLEQVNLEGDASCAAVSSTAEQITEIKKEITTVTTAQPVAIYLMLDISSSMTRGFSVPTKAQVAVDAINTFVNDTKSSNIAVALNFFPSPQATDRSDCTGTVYDSPFVPMGRLPDPSQIDAISDALTKAPFGETTGTPIEPALRGLTKYCTEYKENPENDGENCVAVLITDGQPTECSLQDDTLTGIVSTAFDSSEIITFGVGMEGADFILLDQIAKAGGAPDCDTTSTSYSCDVSGGTTLLQALELIRDYVTEEFVEEIIEVSYIPVDCEWEIPPPPEGEKFDKNYVNIEFTDKETGEVRTIGRVDSVKECIGKLGWYYDNMDKPTRIIACPDTTCPQIQQAAMGKVDVLFGCATEVL